ncbi:DUF4087 domain-containing protein [Ancylobacter terrae]|uniref:DUF4087 domain-containing protein n=1 Tax=Ancylobacter sp. sgz301288 TaxID=3342077 RepID=UPI003859320A
MVARATFAALAVALFLAGTPILAAENRCGWYVNPTPGNLILIDRDADWWITTQLEAGGPNAAGADENLPDFDPKQYVKTQPNGYGYGCACLSVETDNSAQRITRVYSGRILPLARCRGDKALRPVPR